MQAVKDTYNDNTSNILGNVILLNIQTKLENSHDIIPAFM